MQPSSLNPDQKEARYLFKFQPVQNGEYQSIRNKQTETFNHNGNEKSITDTQISSLLKSSLVKQSFNYLFLPLFENPISKWYNLKIELIWIFWYKSGYGVCKYGVNLEMITVGAYMYLLSPITH